ncbi:FKBP-type peptidyl-prolyl cis-trans isomerase [Bernardetia sp. Wsw4-3y2]|uniref:FKBP-type peptidyl-prolyl cis-trans isomerase n=1 Tax=Bernardetia sp. Wsw4-3y2 TaxID=3127471 RepID=UPI0030CEAE55
MKLSLFYTSIFNCLFLLITFSVSAQFETGMQEHKGIRYKIRKVGKGKILTDSSIFQIQMKIFNSTDSLLRDSYTEDTPLFIDLNDKAIREMSMVEVIRKGKIGDSLTVFVHADSIFSEEQPHPDFIKEGSWIRQEIRIIKDYTTQEYEDTKIKIQEKREKDFSRKVKENEYKLDSISKIQVEYIEKTYFVEKGITNYKKTEFGLLYTIDKQGRTDIETGDKIKAHYKGTLLKTGEKFDSSYDRGEPIEVAIGIGQVIQGWDEGIPLIGKGGKGTLYIPSNLGYGLQGSQGAIPPNTMLIFEVEVLDEDLDNNQDYENEQEEETTSQKKPNTYYIDDNQEDYIENVYLKLNDITDYKKTVSGLFYRIEKQGTPIKKGEKVKIRYEETFLMTDENLDSSHDSEKIYEITIGKGNFIKGWEEGIPIIGKGGIGYLYIPSKLAYGKEEVGEQLEPDAMLIYKIEILEN